MTDNEQPTSKSNQDSTSTRGVRTAKALIPRVRLKPSEVVVHFDESNVSSQEVIAQAREIGIDLGMTASELDTLRARGPQLRLWLSGDLSRRQLFARNPRDVLMALEGKPTRRGRSHRLTPQVRWRGLTDKAVPELAGTEVADWVLGESGRLALLIKDPRMAVEAALVTKPSWERKKLLERIGRQTTESGDASKGKK